MEPPMHRRDFFRQVGAGSAFAAMPGIKDRAQATRLSTGPADDRAFWLGVLRRLADPVLTNLANDTLKARMPVEQAAGANRETVTHLEALGRLIAGIAPWLELAADDTEEGRQRARYCEPARRARGRAVHPTS